MRFSFILMFIFFASCAQKTLIRSPSAFKSKYDAFLPGTKIHLKEPVVQARKEETIYQDSKCEIQKYCRFEIDNDPHRKLTMRGEYIVDSINTEEDKLILLTKEKEKIQLDCGLKYSMKKISVENDRYCDKLVKGYQIFTFPEFMQTIIDIEITYLEP